MGDCGTDESIGSHLGQSVPIRGSHERTDAGGSKEIHRLFFTVAGLHWGAGDTEPSSIERRGLLTRNFVYNLSNYYGRARVGDMQETQQAMDHVNRFVAGVRRTMLAEILCNGLSVDEADFVYGALLAFRCLATDTAVEKLAHYWEGNPESDEKKHPPIAGLKNVELTKLDAKSALKRGIKSLQYTFGRANGRTGQGTAERVQIHIVKFSPVRGGTSFPHLTRALFADKSLSSWGEVKKLMMDRNMFSLWTDGSADNSRLGDSPSGAAWALYDGPGCIVKWGRHRMTPFDDSFLCEKGGLKTGAHETSTIRKKAHATSRINAESRLRVFLDCQGVLKLAENARIENEQDLSLLCGLEELCAVWVNRVEFYHVFSHIDVPPSDFVDVEAKGSGAVNAGRSAFRLRECHCGCGDIFAS